MPESSMKAPDRRQAPRTKLVEIAYIGMGPENGGLVLDVSDGGLSFHAVAPVQPAETVRFLLSLRGHSRIEGTGEIVWTNTMRTVCGMKFTALSAGAREHLDNWTNQPRMPVAPRKQIVAPIPPTVPAASEAIRSEAVPVFAIPPVAEADSPEPTASMEIQKPLFFWIAFGLLASALAVTGFIYGVHVGRSEYRTVARLAADTNPQTQVPMLEPAPVPDSSSASGEPANPTDTPSIPNGSAVDAAKTDNASPSSIQHAGAEGNSATPPDQRAELQLAAGKSELAAALSYLDPANSNRDSSKAARLLWAAVSNGNSTAEAVLGDLYLRGDGVAKSCEQGRVLLHASAISGNLQGQQKLDELDTNGCP